HNQRDGVFQVGAGGENRLRDWDRRHRGGGIATGTPQNYGTKRSGAGDGVIPATRDRPLANQERVGNSGETLRGFFIAIRNRLTGSVGTRHHESFGRARGKEQVM